MRHRVILFLLGVGIVLMTLGLDTSGGKTASTIVGVILISTAVGLTLRGE